MMDNEDRFYTVTLVIVVIMLIIFTLAANGANNFELKTITQMKTEMDTLRPNYYKGDGKIEVWDFVISQNLGFFDGNIVKYVCRYKGKNGLEDLKKARQYLDKLIAINEQEQGKSSEKEKDTNDIKQYIKTKIHQATEMIDIINQESAREKWEKEQREWWAGHKQAYKDCLRVLDNHKE